MASTRSTSCALLPSISDIVNQIELITAGLWGLAVFFVFLDVQQVTDDPPGEKENNVALEGDRMKDNALEPIKAVPNIVPTYEHGRQGIRDGENEKVVVAKCLGYVAMDEGVEGTLKAACRAKCPGA